MNKTEYAAEKYDEFRDYMVRRIDRRKYNLEFFSGLFYDVLSYSRGHTLTVAKVILMSGMDRTTFYQAKNGKYDDSLAMYLYKEGIEESEADIVDGLPVHNGVILLPPSEIIFAASGGLSFPLPCRDARSVSMPGSARDAQPWTPRSRSSP